MKKKIVIVLVCVFLLNLFAPGALLAKDDTKIKDFIPPGLLKGDKVLPPPFQHLMFKWKGEIEGKIMYKKTFDNVNWIVVEGNKTLKALMLSSNQNYSKGEWVKVEYILDKVVKIERIREKEKDDDDDDDDDDKLTGVLSYGLNVTPSKANLGEKMKFKLEIKNKTNKNIATRFSSGMRYDFLVKKDGKKVWRWSDDMSFITVIQNLTFEPGDTATFTEEWIPEASGTYTVEAYFMGQSRTQPVLTKNFTVVQEQQEKNLQYKLEVMKGDPNLFVLQVTNPLNTALNVTTSNGQIFDFLLTKNGQKVWRWSDGQNFTQAVQNVRFAAKETKIYFAQYKTASTGEYQLYGFFKGDGAKAVGPQTFTIQ